MVVTSLRFTIRHNSYRHRKRAVQGNEKWMISYGSRIAFFVM